jgi:hypothetical protein
MSRIGRRNWKRRYFCLHGTALSYFENSGMVTGPPKGIFSVRGAVVSRPCMCSESS